MTKDTVTTSQVETGIPAVAPPRSLADIPGLGPIRVRALNKAGWNSVSALRSAKLEALAAVPGMTEVKAQQIYDYLQPFTPEDLTEAPATESPKKPPVSEPA